MSIIKQMREVAQPEVKKSRDDTNYIICVE